RAAGLQGDPNFFAVFQTAALPPTLALAANERRPPVRAAYYAVVVVIMLSVVASLSRTGLLAFVGVVIVSLFLPWRFFRTRSRKAAYVVAICLLIPAVAAVGSTSFIKRADSIFHPNSVASDRGSGRTDIWRAALHGYGNHPWLGLGAGNFEKESLSLLETTPGVNTTAFYAQTSKVAHNAYIETLTELGPVGLAIFLAMLFLTGRTIMSAYRRARAAKERAIERYALALLLSFAALLVASTFLSDQLSKITWILIGLALALEVMTRNLAPVAALYHPVVHEAVEDPSDRRRSDEYAALRAERARLARLADELDARQRALAERAADLDAREEALARRAAEREQGHRS
ncbi:MAG: O-antigen ligase family protein, partial [Actinobacteria bacterium]|nr:O-antigen ligase family protein [Actinomycetota bacterium]